MVSVEFQASAGGYTESFLEAKPWQALKGKPAAVAFHSRYPGVLPSK